jgi:putative Mg2+ transporter-C (MgtC) family protein
MEVSHFSLAFETNALLKLLLAILLGGVIGLEREFRGRPAGLRTNILVCLGATMIMIGSTSMAEISQILSPNFRVTVDPGRIAAGIVTGIGFLGAGAIIRFEDVVRGLTTAGCIWFVAALGIAIGEGLYVLAIMSTVCALVVLLGLTRVEIRIRPTVYRSILVIAPLTATASIESTCRSLLAERNIQVMDIATQASKDAGKAEITFKVRVKNLLQAGEVTRAVIALDGVNEARWF